MYNANCSFLFIGYKGPMLQGGRKISEDIFEYILKAGISIDFHKMHKLFILFAYKKKFGVDILSSFKLIKTTKI